ncbi:MAG: anti-CBASS protein Acb1 family protein [Candidatus Phlomobacter fragariae]
MFTGEEKRLGIEKQAELALKLASLYGGSLLIAVTDEENLEKPLNVNKEQLKGFLVVRQGEYSIRKIATDIFSPYFNRPLLFKLKSAEKIPVHHSRCCLTVVNQITNATVKADKKANDGKSDILAFISDLLGYLYVNDEVLGMLREMKSDIFLLKGLNVNISNGRGKDIIECLRLALQAKKKHNVLMLDSESQYKQKELSLANVSDIWTKAQDRLAVAMDRPKTILFSNSEAEFSTGQEDLQSYYDTIFEIQESRLRPIMNFFDKFICARHGISETEIVFEFVKIKTENKAESASNLNTVTTALILLLEHGVIEPQDALNELNCRELVDVKNVPKVTMMAKMLGEKSDSEFNTQRQINGEGM